MLTVLGSTGSIGRQTLEVASSLGIPVCALAAGSSVKLMEEQCRAFSPRLAVMYDENAARALKTALADTDIRVASGMAGLIEAASLPRASAVLAAMSGAIGLRPTLAAIEAGKRLALANKETLVCAGELVMAAAEKRGTEILPVDSEHSALFQCLQAGGDAEELIITASGGPFLGYTARQLENVTVADALKHPNWSMGTKITVDSATMMNKGLEFIEAMRLFRMPADKISILVHPQSIVHSMVRFADGAVIAQLGTPDMRLPIQLALTWPERVKSLAPSLDLTRTPPLTFLEPDTAAFPCLALALGAARSGGADCAVLNAANETAVHAFLRGEIKFTRIPAVVEAALTALGGMKADTLDDILSADAAARRFAEDCI